MNRMHQYNKSTLRALFVFALLAVPMTVQADIKRGEQLHSNNCAQCHASMFGGDSHAIYTRADRRISTLSGLSKQVRFCVNNLGITWFDDEVQDVTDYLNQNFYRFHQ